MDLASKVSEMQSEISERNHEESHSVSMGGLLVLYIKKLFRKLTINRPLYHDIYMSWSHWVRYGMIW